MSIEITGVGKRFGDFVALESIDMDIAAGEFRFSDPVFMTEELRMLRDQVRRFVETGFLVGPPLKG